LRALVGLLILLAIFLGVPSFTTANADTVVSPALVEQIRNTACPEDYVQHWDKIEFMINSTELAQSLNLTANTELDIRIKDDPKNVTDLKQKVLDFINSPNATRDDISIMDVDYAAICASSTPINQSPVAKITANPTRILAGGDISHLDATGSHDPDGTITNYEFSQSGLTSPGTITVDSTNPAKATFQAPNDPNVLGTVTITLTVTDNDGASSTATVSIVLTRDL
jgi:hypothetical protein